MTTKKTTATTEKSSAKAVQTKKVAAPVAATKPRKTLPPKPAVQPDKVPAPSSAPLKTETKKSKNKVVRDSFTMPQCDYQKIALIKQTCLKAGLHVKKSEVLRAGLNALCELDVTQLERTLAGLEKIKTGRPKEH